MCEELTTELDRGDKAAMEVAEHLLSMGAGQFQSTVKVEVTGESGKKEVNVIVFAAALPTLENLMTEAREFAARVWCDPETSGIVMDPRLCEAFAQRLAIWTKTAVQLKTNADYYRKQIANVDAMLGDNEGPGSPIFSVQELAHMLNDPEAVQSAIDYHDIQATMGEPMGYDCSFHNERIEVLKARKAALIEAIDAC